jgi:hypothetical protein
MKLAGVFSNKTAGITTRRGGRYIAPTGMVKRTSASVTLFIHRHKPSQAINLRRWHHHVQSRLAPKWLFLVLRKARFVTFEQCGTRAPPRTLIHTIMCRRLRVHFAEMVMRSGFFNEFVVGPLHLGNEGTHTTASCLENSCYPIVHSHAAFSCSCRAGKPPYSRLALSLHVWGRAHWIGTPFDMFLQFLVQPRNTVRLWWLFPWCSGYFDL